MKAERITRSELGELTKKEVENLSKSDIFIRVRIGRDEGWIKLEDFIDKIIRRFYR